ncbi:hypothetical protein ON010_g10801 [Phytophthora cinnamomi]|nr:hypothetical protein ON010_g10801 [Phytophthora cinnamomi]
MLLLCWQCAVSNRKASTCANPDDEATGAQKRGHNATTEGSLQRLSTPFGFGGTAVRTGLTTESLTAAAGNSLRNITHCAVRWTSPRQRAAVIGSAQRRPSQAASREIRLVLGGRVRTTPNALLECGTRRPKLQIVAVMVQFKPSTLQPKTNACQLYQEQQLGKYLEKVGSKVASRPKRQHCSPRRQIRSSLSVPSHHRRSKSAAMNAGGNAAQFLAIRIGHLRRVTAHVRGILSAEQASAAPAIPGREQQLQFLREAEQALAELEQAHRSIEAEHARNQRFIDGLAARLATQVHLMWAQALVYAELSDQLRGLTGERSRRSNKRSRSVDWQPAAVRGNKQHQHQLAATRRTMAQGSGYLKKGKKGVKNAGSKPSKKAVSYSHKKSAAKFTKKGIATPLTLSLSLSLSDTARPDPTTEIRRGCSGMKNNGSKAVTGFINQNLENIMASRVLQAGTTLALSDVKAHGKERLKEINQHARTKKKSRVAQKLAALERSIKEQEEGGTRRKRPTAAAVVPHAS